MQKKFILYFTVSLFVFSSMVRADNDFLKDLPKEEAAPALEDTTETAAMLPPSIPSPIAAPSDTEASEEVAKWEYVPVVQVSKWGHEIRIVVEPSILMDREKVPSIQSVRLETEKGKFLGLKTFGPQEVKRRAEFMMDPAALKLDKVKITVNSKDDGDWTSVVSLEEKSAEKKETTMYSETTKEEVSESSVGEEQPATVPPAAQEEQPAPKKKGWFW